MKNYTLPEGKALVLRTCGPNMEAHGGFIWPVYGQVACPDWDPTPKCGHGLHGWLWATGNFGLRNKDPKAKWLVVEVDADKVVNLDKEKVKFPDGNVILTGSFRETYDLVMKWFWLTQVKVSKKSIATEKEECAWEHNDNLSASASGNYGHASASGNYGHASASGNYGHASASGESGHASASGNYGHASASGNYGHASASGYSGHASASGYSGTAAVLGRRGKVKASENGSIILTYWDNNRYRHVVGYVGENGIEKDTWYRLDANNQFEKTSV